MHKVKKLIVNCEKFFHLYAGQYILICFSLTISRLIELY